MKWYKVYLNGENRIWNKYGFYDSIVNEKMKIQLLNLYKANEFLIFKEVQIDNMLVING